LLTSTSHCETLDAQPKGKACVFQVVVHMLEHAEPTIPAPNTSTQPEPLHTRQPSPEQKMVKADLSAGFRGSE
jgi:hypothetical protein